MRRGEGGNEKLRSVDPLKTIPALRVFVFLLMNCEAWKGGIPKINPKSYVRV